MVTSSLPTSDPATATAYLSLGAFGSKAGETRHKFCSTRAILAERIYNVVFTYSHCFLCGRFIMSKQSSKMNENFEGILWIISFIIGIFFIANAVEYIFPNVPLGSYDTRPLCAEGYTATLAAEGSYLVCTEKGSIYDIAPDVDLKLAP